MTTEMGDNNLPGMLAAPDINSSSSDDLLKCAICSNELVNPKILPCIHTFCSECLRKICQESGAGDEMACPTYYKLFQIPDDGTQNLQSNKFLERVIKEQQILRFSNKNLLCDTCQQVGGEGDCDAVDSCATLFCYDCHSKLCQNCGLQHSVMNCTKHHQLIDLNKQALLESIFRVEQNSCSEHSKESLKMFCYDCNSTICIVCFAESHQFHRCEELSKAVDEFQIGLQNSYDKISECLKENANKLKDLEKKKSNNLKTFAKLELNVSVKLEELKKLLDESAKRLLEELTVLQEKRIGEIECKQQEIDRYKCTLENLQKYVGEVKTKGSANDICISFNSLNSRTLELEAEQKAVTLDQRNVNVSFSGLKLKRGSDNVLGKIFYQEESKELISGDSSEVKSKKNKKRKKKKNGSPDEVSADCTDQVENSLETTHVQEENKELISGDSSEVKSKKKKKRKKKKNGSPDEVSADCTDKVENSLETTHVQDNKVSLLSKITLESSLRGVARMDHKLHFILNKSNKIQIFSDAAPFDHVQTIEIKEMARPCYIASSGQALYISETSKRCVWKLDLFTGIQIRWYMDGFPHSISSSNSGGAELLILMNKGGRQIVKSKWFLDTYKPKPSDDCGDFSNPHLPEFIYSVPLPKVVMRPYHAVKLSDESFVVAYGSGKSVLLSGSITFDYMVSRFSTAGVLLYNLDLGVPSWNYPMHLTRGHNDRIFVVDRDNNRVVSIDPRRPKDAEDLITRKGNGLTLPSCICYMEDKQQIVVGQGSKCFDVFSILAK